MEVGGISVKNTLVLPEYARKEAVYGKNRDVIREIDYIIQTSRDLGAVDRRVKAAEWGEKVLCISLTRRVRTAKPAASTDPGTPALASYSKGTWTNLRSVIRDGAGYGTVLTAEGNRDLVIVNNSRPCTGGEEIGYTMYIERNVP